MTSYFRIQTADRDVNDLLEPGQISYHWNEIESYERNGVSVCDSRESLASYLALGGLPYGIGEWVVVELDGEISDDTPCDAAYGEILIHPTEILSVTPMDDDMFDLIATYLED